ncbi:uncharacterized protein LOC142776150 [Rhipicephalus microplus]|uniref:uncharacterized protein LOC142776150 n=1 Tax=Rhipicephalus microplus TaxID=6941 RepID=UPI003F6CF6E7
MSQLTAKKRRKLYLGPDTEFVVPRSTRWYSQQSTSSASATATTRLAGVLNSPPDSSHASQTSPGDRCLTDGCSVDTSSIGVRTEVPEGSDDFFNSAHGVGDNAYQSPEECPDNESNHSENDSEDGDTRPFRDTDQDPSSGTEEDSGDYLCGDGASVNRDQNPGAEGDISGDRSSVPSFDESELLARCIADFGTKTLPGSATTIAVAIVLIMSFIAAHGLSWSDVDDLLKLVEALFGFEKCGLPQSKYLLRKLWSANCDSVSKYHYCCSQCGKLLDISSDKIHLTCNVCRSTVKVSDVKSGGTFFSILDVGMQLSSTIESLSGVLFENLSKLKQQAEVGCHLIRDITSGMMHRTLREKGVLRWSDLTITLNTDGSPLYKSSNSSKWPIQMIINELPAPYRYKNVILGGVWYGRKHPNMLVFLEKFVESLCRTGELIWKYSSTVIHSKIYTICVGVDAPARAAVGNQVQFNSFLAARGAWLVEKAKRGA